MSIYNRTNDLPEEVSSLQKSVDEIKQVQVIGNDNLVVNFYGASSLLSYPLIANTTAIFKTTFTFDSPSDNYLQIFYYFTISSSYNLHIYNDPSTVTDKDKKSFFFTITSNSNVDINMMEPIIKSSMNGTLLFERIA